MEEYKTFLGRVEKYSNLGYGSFSDVFMCDFDGALFAYKEYNSLEHVKLIKDKMPKLTEFFRTNESLNFPYKLVYKNPNDELFKGVILDYLYQYSKLDTEEIDKNKMINILKRVRNLIEIIHKEYNLIHGDLHPENILYNIETDKISIIDFDSSFDINTKFGYNEGIINELNMNYIDIMGIDEGIDTYLFNLVTFKFLCNYNGQNNKTTLQNINNSYYPNLNNKVISILDTYKNYSKKLSKDYIIDYL